MPGIEQAGAQSGTFAPFGRAAVPLTVYGHSFCTNPGQKCTSGDEFYKLLTTALRLSGYTTYGTSGIRMLEQAYAGIGGAFAGIPSGAQIAAPAVPGIYVVDCLFNDYENTTVAQTISPGALSNAQINGIANSLSVLLALMSSSGRQEEPSSGTNWTHNANSAGNYLLSGGFCLGTNTNGASVTCPVTVPASGKLWNISHANDPGTNVQAPASYSIGGTTYATFNPLGPNGAAQFAAIKSQAVASKTYNIGPALTTLTGLPTGSQSIVVQTTGAGWFNLDCFLTPSTTPPVIFVLLDPNPLSTGSAPLFTSGQVATISANKLLLDAAIRSACAGFSNVVIVDTTPLPGNGQSYVDGLHPNDRGMRWIQELLASTAESWFQSNDPDGLYVTL